MRLVDLRTLTDERGSLTVIQKFPFEVKRVYYLHHITPGSMRGAHAHKKVHRLMVAVSGSFKIKIDDDSTILCSPSLGIYIAPLQWVELTEFTPDAVCLVLASIEHDEDDCIRSLEELEKFKLDQSNSALLG